MQVLKASELFKNSINIDNSEFEKSDKINIDFTNIESIDLTAIKMILNLQKVAIINNKKLVISNVNPDVNKILDVTGLNKTLRNVTTNPIRKQ